MTDPSASFNTVMHPTDNRASAGSETPLISLKNVSYTYSTGSLEVHAVNDVSLDVYSGEFLAIVGQSGSGKTTLMNVIGCLSRPTSGEYFFDGESVADLDSDGLARLRRNALGFVFQNYNLLESATAQENVQIPANYSGLRQSESAKRAANLLTELALGDRLGHRPSELSGGEQQRVALARALMNGGRVILADEPTGAVDSKTSEEIISRLEALTEEGHTVIVVTHNAAVSERADRRVQILDGRMVSDSGHEQMRPRQVMGAGNGRSIDSPVSLSFSALSQAVLTAVRSLRAHLFRTSLTLLGIIIGVLSVVMMMSIGEGAKERVMDSLGALGVNAIEVRPDRTFDPGSAVFREPPRLYHEDALMIAEKIANVETVVPWKNDYMMMRRSGHRFNGQVRATTQDAFDIKNLKLAEGTFFNQAHSDQLSPVVVLGSQVRENLFPNGAPAVGAYVLIQDAPFRVIGTLTSSRSGLISFGMDDYSVYVPLATARVRLFGDEHVSSLQVKTVDVDEIPVTIVAIKQLLEARHGKQAYAVEDAGQLMETRLEVISTVSLVFGGIGAISLLVAGIGVMNIMLVSVAQRTREIGIRMAAGARNGDVLLQFLIEAILVCVVGGLVAVGLAFSAETLVNAFNVPIKVSGEPVLVALSVAIATGLVFGFAPAWRAARLDPAVALAAV